MIIDTGKPGASQGTHLYHRRCALTGLTRVNFPNFPFMTPPENSRPYPPQHGLKPTVAMRKGCRWLPARWAEFRMLLDRGCRWNVGELHRFIRLQGKQFAESVYDPVLNVLFVAWDVPVPKFTAEEAVAGPDWADRAALDSSPKFEWLQRYQSAKTWELQRTLDTLRKMRKAEFGVGNERGGMADGECQMADGKCQTVDVPCEVESGGCELKTPRIAPNEADLVSTQSSDARWIESEKADPEGRERSQSAAGGQVALDAGRYDSRRLMEGSTNDAMGISPREQTDAAVEVCQGDGPEQSRDRVEKSPRKAPNEANLKSTQSNYPQDFKSENADPGRRERSQFSGANVGRYRVARRRSANCVDGVYEHGQLHPRDVGLAGSIRKNLGTSANAPGSRGGCAPCRVAVAKIPKKALIRQSRSETIRHLGAPRNFSQTGEE